MCMAQLLFGMLRTIARWLRIRKLPFWQFAIAFSQDVQDSALIVDKTESSWCRWHPDQSVGSQHQADLLQRQKQIRGLGPAVPSFLGHFMNFMVSQNWRKTTLELLQDAFEEAGVSKFLVEFIQKARPKPGNLPVPVPIRPVTVVWGG